MINWKGAILKEKTQSFCREYKILTVKFPNRNWNYNGVFMKRMINKMSSLIKDFGMVLYCEYQLKKIFQVNNLVKENQCKGNFFDLKVKNMFSYTRF